MRVFKATYKDRKGKARESSKWYVEFRGHLGTVRRLPAFTDKKQSETAGRNVEKLVACKINGDPPDKELSRWLEAWPKAMRDKLCGIALLDATSATAGKKLVEHLDAFRAAQVAKNNTADYVRLTPTRVQSLFDGCGFRAWTDIDGAAVEAWLAAEREAGRLSIQTSNNYVGAAKQLDEAGTLDEKAMREQTAFLAYVDDAGRFADFHALRHTFISTLARSGVHPKVAQALARHSTITLTMDRYSHTVLGEQSEAVEALPSLAAATVEAMRATGSDDAAPDRQATMKVSAMKMSAADRQAAGMTEQAQRPRAQRTGAQQRTAQQPVLASSLAERGAVKPSIVKPASAAQGTDDSGPGSVLASCLALETRKLCSNPTFEETILATAESEKHPQKKRRF